MEKVYLLLLVKGFLHLRLMVTNKIFYTVKINVKEPGWSRGPVTMCRS